MKKSQLRSLNDAELSTINGGNFLLRQSIRGVGFAAKKVTPTRMQQAGHVVAETFRRGWKWAGAGLGFGAGEEIGRRAYAPPAPAKAAAVPAMP